MIDEEFTLGRNVTSPVERVRCRIVVDCLVSTREKRLPRLVVHHDTGNGRLFFVKSHARVSKTQLFVYTFPRINRAAARNSSCSYKAPGKQHVVWLAIELSVRVLRPPRLFKCQHICCL